ncbi:MAG: MerR family transcriptional regulator [Gemmatimonadota bacterium]
MRQPLGTKLYYSIGEVAEITQLQPYTLRAWEKEFACLRPRRVRGKNRAYRERDIAVVLLIKRLLYEERYSTRGVQLKLKGEPELLRELNGELADGRWSGGGNRAEGVEQPPEPAIASRSLDGLAEEAGPASVEVEPSLRTLLEQVRVDLREVLRILS